MTDVNGVGSDEPGVSTVDTTQEVETIESLRAKLELANNEAAKYRKQKNDAIKERDAVKKNTTTEETKNWETLYKQAQAEKEQALETSKKFAITAAIKEALMKEKVLPDAIKDAARLVDTGMISWDAEDGVDQFSVESAVKVLRSSSKYLFESKVPASGTPTNPKHGSATSATEITREQFDKLPLQERRIAAKKYTII